MGSFDYTCAASGLPIRGGNAVRYMLLTHSPYCLGKDAGGYQSSPRWFPRTFPIRATYNDYGDVKDMLGEAQQAAWRKGFDMDLVERGWGDNSVHDQSTTKAMNLRELLDAVHSGRLLVHGDVERGKQLKLPVPRWLPTRRRVERRLKVLGHEIYDGNGSGAMVSSVDRATVRVRIGGYGDSSELLAKMRDQLADRWAGMVTCGTGGCAHVAELRLGPKPGKDDHGHTRVVLAPKGERRPILPVTHVMIREDVWQKLCKMSIRMRYENDVRPVERFREDARALWEKSVELAKSTGKIASMLLRYESGSGNVTIRGVPFTVGIEENWRFMVEAAVAGAVAPEEVEEFHAMVGEFTYVQAWLALTRQELRPTPSGPQFGEFELHRQLHEALADVAKSNELLDD